MCTQAATVGCRQRDRAVQMLREKMGARNLERLRERLQLEGPILNVSTRHGLLAWTASALNEGGFGWSVLTCYEVGMELLEEAAFGGRTGTEKPC